MVIIEISFFRANFAVQRVLGRAVWLVLILARGRSSILMSERRPVLDIWLQLLSLFFLILGH